MPNIIIRPATIDDIPAIHALVYELAVYENEPQAHTATIEEYRRDFEAGIFEAQVAIDTENTEGGQIVGMIFYYMAYSTWRGRMLYLEDFVVTEKYRQFGVGQRLFDTFLEVARQKDCFLTKWQVLDWNTPAVNFYQKNKAIIEKEWWNGKIFLKEI
ncbi:MAG: GNAT family N-acetyltransferase [Saprospiraceae bacterium]|nr:GNAT family N-acetyltransferase [Saprospiraceae bacterium]